MCVRIAGLFALASLFAASAICGCRPAAESNPGPSQAQAQAAIDEVLASELQKAQIPNPYGATINGIQLDLPANAASADVTFHGIHFKCGSTPGLFIDMGTPQAWYSGKAQFARYTNGAWVLTSLVSTQSEDSLGCNLRWQGSIDLSQAVEPQRIRAPQLPRLPGASLTGTLLQGGSDAMDETPYILTADGVYRLWPEWGDQRRRPSEVIAWNATARSLHNGDRIVVDGCKVGPGKPGQTWDNAGNATCHRITKMSD